MNEMAAQTSVWEAAQDAQAKSAPSSPLKSRAASVPSPSRNVVRSPGSPDNSSPDSPSVYRLPAPPGTESGCVGSPWRTQSARKAPWWYRVGSSYFESLKVPEFENVQDKAWL